MAEERAQEMNEEAARGLEEDEQYAREFDDITRELKNHHRFGPNGRNDFKVRRNIKDPNEQAGYLAQIGIREASDNRLSFRRLPCVVWVAGTAIIVVALYLLYHLALGEFGVLFEGYR